MYQSSLVPQTSPLSWKISSSTPASDIFHFVKDSILLLNVWYCSEYVCLGKCSDLMLCTASDTFRIILAYSTLFFQVYASTSNYINVTKTYSHIDRVRINFSMLYCEQLFDKSLLVLVSSERPLCSSLMDRKFCNFTCCRFLENIISNVN